MKNFYEPGNPSMPKMERKYYIIYKKYEIFGYSPGSPGRPRINLNINN